jgi:hypothetical protein
MKLMLKLIAAAIVVLGTTNAAHAWALHYLLEVNQSDWTLKAKIDGSNGIGAIAVDLVGVTSGVSDAPRATLFGNPVSGFTQGNAFVANRAAANQQTSAPGSVVYNIGINDVPDSAFGAPTTTMIGSALRDANGYVSFYHGTNSEDYSADFATTQPSQGSAGLGVFVGINETIYHRVVVPEPQGWLLAAFAITASLLMVSRRNAVLHATRA